MFSRRVAVFISSASRELAPCRETVRDALLSAGILPVTQEAFPPDHRKLHDFLRRKIAECDAVILLVGRSFGAAPPAPEGPRRSYAQLEYDVALSLRKRIYPLLTTDSFVPDAPVQESPEDLALQEQHRQTLMENQKCEWFSTREELRLRTADIVASLPKPRPLATAAGVLLVLGALLLAAWLGLGRLEDARVRDLEARAAASEERVSRILERSEALAPPLASEVLRRAGRELSVAGMLRDRGRDRLQASDTGGAEASLQLAVSACTEACALLLEGGLRERAESRAQEAIGRASELGAAGAPELSRAKWTKLQGLVAKIGPPDSVARCAVAEHQLERIERSYEVAELSRAIEQDLRSEWPRLARRAREDAIGARAEAEARAVAADEFIDVLERAKAALDEGDAALESERFLAARQFYVQAQDRFQEAIQVAPAASARAGFRALAGRASGRELSGDGGVKRLRAEAGRAFVEARWEKAAKLYGEAETLLRTLIENEEKAREALAAAEAAEKARAKAVREGAEKADESRLASADEIMSRATEALERKEHAEAVASYREAERIYTRLEGSARRLRAEAELAESRARETASVLLEGGACDELGPPARPPCEAGREALGLGQIALEERDAGDATGDFRAAREHFQSARSLQEDYLANRPQPPYLVRRKPSSRVVRFFRGTPVKLSVEAEDPNEDDELEYSWMVDNVMAGGEGASFVHRTGRNATIRVTVSDGHGGSLTEEWKLVSVNRPPQVSLEPSASTIEVGQGVPVAFEISARDPDGDGLETAFFVDGEKVRRATAYEFRAGKPGSYRVQARVRDEGGASVELERRVVVRAEPGPAPEEERAREPAADGAPPGSGSPAAVSAAPPQWEPRKAALAALAEYELAYEAGDLGRLSRVWAMNRGQRRAMREFFDRMDHISLHIEKRGIDIDREMVFVHFDQEVDAGGVRGALEKERVSPMTATVIPKADGSWIISSILPRR